MSFITALQNTENARVVGETKGYIIYLLFNTSNYGLRGLGVRLSKAQKNFAPILGTIFHEKFTRNFRA